MIKGLFLICLCAVCGLLPACADKNASIPDQEAKITDPEAASETAAADLQPEDEIVKPDFPTYTIPEVIPEYTIAGASDETRHGIEALDDIPLFTYDYLFRYALGADGAGAYSAANELCARFIREPEALLAQLAAMNFDDDQQNTILQLFCLEAVWSAYYYVQFEDVLLSLDGSSLDDAVEQVLIRMRTVYDQSLQHY